MTLQDVISRDGETKFFRFGNRAWDSISIRDIDGETLQVISMNALDTIDIKYLNSEFLSIGASSERPNRIRIRIKYTE